ncbi:MAG: YceI family protein [Verrucomicrobia bacterium]|nr:YceI family protein [Verrucomicrobiota bacterium]
MKSSSLLITLLLTLATVAALTAETATRWNGTSEIQFSGTSTLHNWSGKVSAEPFVAKVMLNGDNRPTSLKAKVEVKAANMDTAEPKRDENMHKDMKVTTYPLITGTMDTAFDKIMPGGKAPTKLPFTLTILGSPQPVEGSISNWVLKGDVVTFDLDFELSLKKCGITVPAVLLVITVGDTIKLHAPVKLVRAGN